MSDREPLTAKQEQIYNFIKSEIYDGKLHPIKLESQLIMKQIRIIYVKITYISEEEINSWRKRIKSRGSYGKRR